MSIIKKWSTGKLGNEFPDHSDRGNSNTRGLTTDNIPGIEAYIEEDEVIAGDDNRPIRNLVENDVILENNLTDVTSEVDYGILRNRYDEFGIEVGGYESLLNPNEGSNDYIDITPLRVKSGSIFINGSVVRTGNQKIIYFIKTVDGNETEFLFPQYNEFQSSIITTIYDQEFTGEYIPVFGTIADNIPSNYDEYEIRIINTYSNGSSDRITYFKTYRDWEDLTPYPPDESHQEPSPLNFKYDSNYGQKSEGVWLQPNEDLINIKVSDIEVKKDIKVNDKFFSGADFKFNPNTGNWEDVLITDGIFFDNVRWESNIDNNIQSLYVDEDGNLFFIYDFTDSEIPDAGISLHRITAGSEQVLRIPVLNLTGGKIPTKIQNVGDYLFVLGTNGLIRFLNIKLEEELHNFNSLTLTEDVRFVNTWEKRLWVATDTKLYHTDYSAFTSSPSDSVFDVIDISNYLGVNYNFNKLSNIQGIYPISGNYVVDSSLVSDITNMLKNPSFEDGGVGNRPIEWSAGSTTDEEGSRSNLFTIGSGSSLYGQMRGILNPQAGDTNSWIGQTVDNEFELNKDWTFSVHVKSTAQNNITLKIIELGEDGGELDSSTNTQQIATVDIWERFEVTHNIQNDGVKLKVEIIKDGTEKLQIDGAQLELGTQANQFVYGFSYLLVAFRKVNDSTNPPFALIDSRSKYDIQYTPGVHGRVGSINDILYVGGNQIKFIDDKNIYNMNFMNSIDSYDRISISNITDSLFEEDFGERIDKLQTIEEMDDRIYIGSSILNKTISFTISDGFEHTVELLPPEQGDNVSNFLNIIGDYSFIQAVDNSPAVLEFEVTKPLVESDSGFSELHKYEPNTSYGFRIRVDGGTIEEYTGKFILPASPSKNQGPWELDDIKQKIELTQGNNDLFSESSLGYTLNWRHQTSTTEVDGLYSIGRNKITKYLRGNIRQIFKQKNTEDKPREERNLYIIRDNTILRLKYDPNIKKIGDSYPKEPGNITGYVDSMDQLPNNMPDETVYYVNGWGYYKWSTAQSSWVNINYFHRWSLYDEDFELREFKKVANKTITFNDTTHDKMYVDIPVDAGYDILDGSLRLKVGLDTEYGFVENLDYFVDYEENKLIRNSSRNFLEDPKFEFISSSESKWKTWQNYGDMTFISSEDGAKLYLSGTTWDRGTVSQIYTPSTLSVGETYTFSIYVRSNITTSVDLVLSEINSSDTGSAAPTAFGENFDYENRSSSLTIEIVQGLDSIFGQWKRYEISHTIQHTDTDKLRAEFTISDDYEIFIKNAQLERNSYSTPFIVGSSYSRIDPNDTVYCDFIQYRVLDDLEYSFNVDNRRICLKSEPEATSEFFFDYKYERIFNPYRFGNSLPRFDVKYDPKDDYFLYENSGRVWAINQILALLSLDEDNPIYVSYRYYFPRIDKIKIRNKPDKYGNFLYYVKGEMNPTNPYAPIEDGLRRVSNVEGRLIENFSDLELEDIDTENNDVLYEINVTSYDFDKNDIYDRRIFVESEASPYYNISLQNETLAYFPFEKDFVSTNGLHPLKPVEKSRITSIVKNYQINQNEEVGAWSSNYEINLRYKDGYPEKVGASLSTFVNADTGQDNNPAYDGKSKIFPFKTIGKALEAIKEGTHHPNIIVTSTSTIYEDVEVEIETVENVLIKAETYFKWRGNFYNKSDIVFQGIIFENFNHYVASDIYFYHCDFIDSSISNFYPLIIDFYNCKINNVKNTFLSVSPSIFPNVFIHPYMKSDTRSDGVDDDSTVATSDYESIHPNEQGYNFTVTGSPRGYYTFYRCLINRVNEDVVDYNIGEDKDWKSDFTFEKCTIVNSQNLFRTKNPGQNILYNECILWNDGFYANGRRYWFDSVSSIEFLNTFVDFEPRVELLASRNINYNPMGELFGRETCEFSGPDIDPGFVETESLVVEDYHLKSVAKGFLFDSPAIGMSSDGSDIGCYDEIRERLDLDIPTKFKSNFALIQESILYPIIINSEKITVTFEFKPTSQYSESGILFDTRSTSSDEDYIVLAYNNNSGQQTTNPVQDPDADESIPYTFKLIVANKLNRYAVVSPIKIDSDSEFQVWHRISFTVNYEKTFNQKASFDEKDRYQNIVTFYHNDRLSVESFLKNDLNRDEKGDILLNKFSLLDPEEREQYSESEISNSWNFNNISDFISLGGAFDNTSLLNGYYAELRIDNKFTNRKELRAWNNKKLPFNDPESFVDESTLVKTIDSNILNEYWPLKDEYGIGVKGNKFGDKTSKRLTYDSGEIVWSLSKPTVNLIQNSDFEINQLAHVTADNEMDLPGNLSKRMFIRAQNSRVSFDANGNDGNGVEIRFYEHEDQASTGIDFTLPGDVVKHIQNELLRVDSFGNRVNGNTKIRVRLTEDRKIEFYTLDWAATAIEIFWENPGDPYEIGFSDERLDSWEYESEITEVGSNIYFVDSMREDSYTPNGTPSHPFKLFSVARTFLEEGIVIKVVNGQTTPTSQYSDFGIDTSGSSTIFLGKSLYEEKKTDIEVYGISSPSSLDRHEVWVDYNPIYARLSGNSLGVKKKFLEDEHLKVYFDKIKNNQNEETKLSIGVEYTFSAYIYSKDEITSQKIRFTKIENGVEIEDPYETFDSIEKVFGGWVKATKYIESFSDQDAKVGVVVLSDFEMFIDAVQLEASEFPTPYIRDRSDNHGVLEINKSLVSEESGIIFFRFKPILKWDTEEKVTLLHAVKYQQLDGELVYGDNTDHPLIDWNTGFKVSYEYNSIIERGVVEFKTNQLNRTDNSTHRFYIPEVLWDKWHSVAIYYNYPTNRFMYFFDHFKQDIESVALQAPFGSNLFIGRDVPKIYTSNGEFEWLNSGDDINKPSANILVKDLIFTNYNVSEKEVLNWINAKEFYKESFFSHLLNEYRYEILQRIRDIELVSSNTEEVVAKIESFESDILNFEQNINNSINTEIPIIQSTLSNHSTQLISHDSRIITAENLISNIQSGQATQNDRLDTVESKTDNNYTLITDETQERIEEDTIIVNRLASHALGDGASTVGIHDGANRFSSTHVEGALQELAGVDRNADHTVKGNYDLIQNNINLYDALNEDVGFIKDGGDGSGWTQIKATNNGWNIQDLRTDIDSNNSDISALQADLSNEVTNRQQGDLDIINNLASTSGASMVGVEDVNNIFSQTTVESILGEITGIGRTTQTIKSNHDAILSNDNDISNIQSDISDINTDLLEVGKVKDGNDGLLWNSTMNLKSHDDAIATANSNISNNTTAISQNLTRIDNNEGAINTVSNNLDSEIVNRQTAITNLRNNLASTATGSGASLIGISDLDNNFTASTVEGALEEIEEKLQILQSSLSWQEPVATKSELPELDNGVGDARTVLDDGDGHAAQYVWNGTIWVKIADINWGSASDVSFDNSLTQIEATNVQDAIVEAYEKAQDTTKAEDSISASGWSSGADGRFFHDIEHELGTYDVTVLPTSGVDGRVVGVDEVETISPDITRVWVTSNDEGLDFTVFGGVNNYSKVVGSWTSAGGDNSLYTHTINHNLNTTKLMYSIFDQSTGRKTNIEEFVFTDENTITLWTNDNLAQLNVFLLRRTSNTKIKDIDNWVASDGMYIASIKMPEEFDAIYSFIDASGRATDVDDIWFDNGFLKIRSSSDEKLRLVILK